MQAIIFDFDGTLVDASEVICASFNAVLRDHGLSGQPPSWIKARIGRPLVEMFGQVMLDTTPEGLLDLVEDYRRVFLPLSVPMSAPMPGAGEALELLAPHVKMAIATSRKADGADHILRGLGLRDHFELIVGIDEVHRVKPHPEPVLRAIEQLHVPASAAAMIGDTPDDMIAGRAAGLLAIGVTTGAHDGSALTRAGAHRVASSLLEVVSIVLPKGLHARKDISDPIR